MGFRHVIHFSSKRSLSDPKTGDDSRSIRNYPDSASARDRKLLTKEPLSLLFAGVSLLLLFWLSSLPLQHKALAFDLTIRGWFHAFASVKLTSAFVLVSRLGSWFVLLAMGMLIAILFANRSSEVRLLTISLYGAIILSALLKMLFHVDRPEPFFGLAIPETYAFPSAHALVSCCFFLVMARLVNQRLRSRSLRYCVWILATLLIAVIGASRVYLGMQYPTSVLAGYAAAVVWVESARSVVQRLSSKLGGDSESA